MTLPQEQDQEREERRSEHPGERSEQLDLADRVTIPDASVTPLSRVSQVGLWPDIALLGVALIWGINIPLMKIGLDRVDHFVFNAVRLTISALILALFVLGERKLGRIDLPGISPARRSVPWRVLILYSLMVSAIYQLLFLLGIARTTSGNCALIISTVPMWTALFSRCYLGERLPPLAWIGLFVALTGTAIVALQKGDVAVGPQHLSGNLLVLGSALLWAGSTVFSRPMLEVMSPMRLAATGALISLPIHWLVAVGRYQVGIPAIGSMTIGLILLYSGLLSSGLSQPMWHYGVRQAGPSHAAIVQNLIPVIAIVAAWLIRGESVSGSQLFGGGLIMCGLLTMRWSRRI